MAAHAYARILVTSGDEGLGTNAIVIAELKFFDTSGTQIPTTGGTASSNRSSGSAGLAFDGNASTYWDSGGPGPTPASPIWLQYHFTSAVDIFTFSITARPDGVGWGPTYFSLQVSDNGSSWTPVYTYNGVCGFWNQSAGRTLAFATTGCVWRISITDTEHGTDTEPIVSDLRFFDESGAPLSTAVGLALGSSAYSPPSEAFAGSCLRMWRAGANLNLPGYSPAFIGFQFPAVATVGSFTFRTTASDPSPGITSAPSVFTLETSLDGENFTQVGGTFTAESWTLTCQAQSFGQPTFAKPFIWFVF